MFNETICRQSLKLACEIIVNRSLNIPSQYNTGKDVLTSITGATSCVCVCVCQTETVRDLCLYMLIYTPSQIQ